MVRSKDCMPSFLCTAVDSLPSTYDGHIDSISCYAAGYNSFDADSLTERDQAPHTHRITFPLSDHSDTAVNPLEQAERAVVRCLEYFQARGVSGRRRTFCTSQMYGEGQK